MRGLKEYKKSSVLAFSIIVIFLIIFLAFESLTLIYPRGVIVDRSITFEWRGSYDSYHLLVDDDSEFKSPMIDVVLESDYFVLDGDIDFGEYYWKLVAVEDGKITESKPIRFVFMIHVQVNQFSLF